MSLLMPEYRGMLVVRAQNELRHQGAMSIVGLATALGVHRSRIYSRVTDWVKRGYVLRVETGVYDVGPTKAGEAAPPELTEDARCSLWQMQHGPKSLPELADLLDADTEATLRAVLMLVHLELAEMAEDGRFELTGDGLLRAEVES